MSIAVSIFLSALFLGFVALYIKSDRKEKWRKSLLFLIGIPFAVLFGVFLYLVIDEQIEKRSWKSFPQNDTSIRGINLGDSLSDLQFKYGKFTKEKEQNRGYDLYNVSSFLTVWTKSNKVEMITYQCDLPPDHSALGKIQCGDFGEAIIKEYGAKNVEIKCFVNDDTRRFYGVEKKKHAFVLEGNSVIWLQLNRTHLERPANLKDCT